MAETPLFTTRETGHRLVVTLDRPPVNAISDAWHDGLARIVDGLAGRDDLAVLHLRSAQKVFCAGMDLDQVASYFGAGAGPDAMKAAVAAFGDLFDRIEALPQVVLAEIGGAALGGGLELALACDLRIASTRARLGLPEAKLGLIPGIGGTQRLTRLCGRGVAARVILAGETFDGTAAAAVGLVERLVEPDALEAEAEALARAIEAMSPAALREAKALIRLAGEPGRGGFAAEHEAVGRLVAGDDTRGRVGRFLAGHR